MTLQNIAAIISKLAVRAPVSNRRQRWHLLLFDHSTNLADEFVGFLLPLLGQIEDHGIDRAAQIVAQLERYLPISVAKAILSWRISPWPK